MGYSISQWRKAIVKLLELTSENSISWETSNIYQGDAWTLVDDSMMATMNEKIYTISKTRSKHYLDEDQFVWSLEYNFSIFIGNKYSGYHMIASAPDTVSLETLYEKAQANRAFNQDALGDLLD